MRIFKTAFTRKLLAAMLCVCALVLSLPAMDAHAAVKLNRTSLTLSTYHTYKLKVAGAKKVKWSSSNPAIATVSDKGVVTANAKGSASVYAKAGKKKLACKVKIVEYDRHIERAAYGMQVLADLIGKDAKISNLRSGNFMNGTEFSYFQAAYTDAARKNKNCYVYIYQQEEKSAQQLNLKTALYGNLVIRIDSLEMERMMQDRSSQLKQSAVEKCLSILKKTETIKFTKGTEFDTTHAWMEL